MILLCSRPRGPSLLLLLINKDTLGYEHLSKFTPLAAQLCPRAGDHPSMVQGHRVHGLQAVDVAIGEGHWWVIVIHDSPSDATEQSRVLAMREWQLLRQSFVRGLADRTVEQSIALFKAVAVVLSVCVPLRVKLTHSVFKAVKPARRSIRSMATEGRPFSLQLSRRKCSSKSFQHSSERRDS
jgi:hypothetical protein